MTKVTITQSGPTTSAQIIAAANATFEEKDRRGRVLTMKKPALLSQFRLTEAMGPETAENGAYRAMCLPLMWLTAIDGEAVNLPTTKLEIEAMIQRLDEDGFVALHTGIQKYNETAAAASIDSAKN